ncbi:PSP1 domain-containing protein [Desulforhopalus singaporensis]|uniref:PSP1 C-terminal conserved region n=1 Tax=Desulforhopalus singaporensis TaxID=91360 RepID=A0A1H0JV94_9BACT|nr:regulatory iron-sulfur-containing complex subunit RicT [Desulforhopalus singaporensis]SDO47321.1 PSP1 C-terminal conserved region [Desulforhopalus singaporensis]
MTITENQESAEVSTGESIEKTGEKTEQDIFFYRVQYRDDGQFVTASCSIDGLPADSVVMVQTDHGLEPCKIRGIAPMCGCREHGRKVDFEIKRMATKSELNKFENLAGIEDRAFQICTGLIKKHNLKMSLVRVERFFNGSKMIFYFTAENRVDFRGLVKDLVQEFRTRVEMRQIGVRHETKMIGGIGTCGRELCCSSFIKKFDSVSIKMAKEQDLPLNPTKISGVCNRLLCCLTYEYDTYRRQRKKMPKPGRSIIIDDEQYLVRRQLVLQDAIIVENSVGEEKQLERDQWRTYRLAKKETQDKRKEKKSRE